MRLILDVDTGIDDALALVYASANRAIELAAVTCVAGNVDLDHVAQTPPLYFTQLEPTTFRSPWGQIDRGSGREWTPRLFTVTPDSAP